MALAACLALLHGCGVTGADVLLGQPYLEEEGFYQVDGRYTYDGEQGICSKTGVDVSENQDYIDWQAVAADGIEFAMIRLGYRGSDEGGLYQDAYFEYNLPAARQAGLECGVYFFSQALNAEEAREEAEFVLSALDGAPLEYPVVFDHEQHAEGINSRTAGMDYRDATAAALAFCQTVEAAGYQAAIYGNRYDLERYELEELEGYPLWYAQYGALPSTSRSIIMWQYTNSGSVAGIDTEVDLNLDVRP